MDRADSRDGGKTVSLQPSAKLTHRFDVGAAGVGIPDLRGEEFQEAVGRAVASCRDQGRGGIAAGSRELIQAIASPVIIRWQTLSAAVTA
jgi:hypothetical protein